MDMRIENVGGAVVLKVAGKLNTTTAPEFNKFVQENVKGPCDMTVDFAKLEFLSSAGIRSLMVLRSIVGADRIKIINAHGLVREVFEISRLTAILGD